MKIAAFAPVLLFVLAFAQATKVDVGRRLRNGAAKMDGSDLKEHVQALSLHTEELLAEKEEKGLSMALTQDQVNQLTKVSARYDCSRLLCARSSLPG